jgi:branched-chain amino acid transport system substrate-binding protein
MKTTAICIAMIVSIAPAFAADPVRIGVTTTLSGPDAVRGHSEQYGVELALARINQAGGVLGRPVEVFYGDNASDPLTGIQAVHRLIDQQHVTVLIGGLLTAVTHAIMPVAQDAKVPLVIEISSLQDFVEASGVGGNPYAFKIIPSELDIARATMGWLKKQGAKRVVMVSDDSYFNNANSQSFSKAASEQGIAVATSITVARGTTNFEPIMEQIKAINPDHVIPILNASTAGFFSSYEKSGLSIPLTGRIDFPAVTKAVSPGFRIQGRFGQCRKRVDVLDCDRKSGGAGFRPRLRGQVWLGAQPTAVLCLRGNLPDRRRDPPGRFGQVVRYRTGIEDNKDAVTSGRNLCAR